MKRWAIITVALYGLILILLTIPAVFVACARLDISPQGIAWQTRFDLDETLRAMGHWGYWVFIGVFVAAQALLLFVPVAAAGARPVARRHVLIPTITCAFLLANLFLSGVCAVIAAAMGDKMDGVLTAPADWITSLLSALPGVASFLGRHGLMPNQEAAFALELCGLMIVAWMFWGLVFFSFAKADDDTALIRRATRWLLGGSILELLIAVPSHILIRQRDDCCAPIASFWGIVTGICVMLMSFGPGVLFLYARRMRDKQARLNKPPVIREA